MNRCKTGYLSLAHIFEMVGPVTDGPILTHVAGQNDPAHLKWFRSLVRGRTRVALAWVFAGLLVFCAREMPTWPGILLCFIGATIRFWASGYLRKDTRPAVGGPYAYVRNPLYLGTYLMALGTALAVQAWALLALGSVLFAVIYHFIILDEEIKLREIFGAPYVQFCSVVPPFFPRPWPASSAALQQINPEPAYHAYDWKLSMKNKSYEAYATFAGLIAFVWLCSFVWQRFQ
jgi:protein-S-isoprenylcysteine O-methyltransferase Ste14